MITIIENGRRATFRNKDMAIRHYKEKTLFGWKDEDIVNTRRIWETLKSTDVEKVSDSHEKEKYILKTMCKKGGEGSARLFRLGDNEVIRIEKNVKGAGIWYNILLHDGTFDPDNGLDMDAEHIIHSEECFQNQFEQVLHDAIFRKGAWA